MNRRTFGTVTLASLMSAAGLTRGATANGTAGVAVSGMSAPGSLFTAQDSSPVAVEDLGLPDLAISITTTAIDGVPATLDAGRYLLVVSAAADLEFGGGVEFARPVGVPADELMALLTAPAEGPLPPAVWESTYAGGVFAQAGATVRGIVDLGPGEWVVYGGVGNPQQPFTIEVTGELPADLADPDPSATLVMSEYAIEVTEGEMVAGTQWVRIDNIGAQPHFIVANFTEMEVTRDDVAAVLNAEMTGTPAAVAFNPETDLTDAFYTANQSTNTTLWIEVDLQPGTYVLLCFFPDLADGMPHAMHGMFEVITIGE